MTPLSIEVKRPGCTIVLTTLARTSVSQSRSMRRPLGAK